MLQYSDIVEFNEELYKKNVEENTFVETDDFDGKGEDDATVNEG